MNKVEKDKFLQFPTRVCALANDHDEVLPVVEVGRLYALAEENEEIQSIGYMRPAEAIDLVMDLTADLRVIYSEFPATLARIVSEWNECTCDRCKARIGFIATLTAANQILAQIRGPKCSHGVAFNQKCGECQPS